MPASTQGDSVLIGKILGANLNVLGDQQFTMSPGISATDKWFPEKIVLSNSSIDANGWSAGINTQPLNGGQSVAAFTLSTAGTVYGPRAVCVAGMDGPNTVNPNKIATLVSINPNTAYLNVTHVATAGAGTVDVFIYGRLTTG